MPAFGQTNLRCILAPMFRGALPRIGPPCHSPLVGGANGRPTGVEAMIIAFANAALVLSDVVWLYAYTIDWVIGVRCVRLYPQKP